MKLYKRKLQHKIKPWLARPDIVVILGARQVGKTTLLGLLKKEIKQKLRDSKNILTFNLEDADQLSALNRNPKYFNEYCILSGADPDKESIVLIDEIQYLDDPSHFLKYIADFEPSIKLIITGSTSFSINKFKDSVVGRKKMFTLFPLDFQEFLLFKGKNRQLSAIDKLKLNDFDLNKIDVDPERIAPVKREIGLLFEEYILYGGYPKVVLAGAREEKLQELKELYDAYELKDINILFNIANITAFRNLFKVLAGSIGCLLNVNEISGTIGIGRDTVLRYLSVLENSFIISTLPPFHNNIRKELTKMPKLFFHDTGLRNFALRNFSEINFRPDKGSLFENAIFCELFRNRGVIDQLYFWRTISKIEVDFVLTGERKLAFEVKSSSAPNIKVHKGLKAFKKIYSDFEQIVVTFDRFSRRDDITYVPGWMI